jgi:4-hydroxy-tetrahydrodipicolinate synthase
MSKLDIRKDPHQIAGLGLAIVTPLTDKGEPDLPALSTLTRHCADGGVDVFYPLGTTGEGALLTQKERNAVVKAAVEAAGGKPIIAGAGAISTDDSVDQAKAAKDCGANAVLVVTPPYVKPTLSGLMKHYEAVAKVGLPIVAYVVPGRTALAVSAPHQAKILEIDGVVAIKEASADLVLMAQVAAAADKLGKLLLVGDDALALPGIAVGAHGLVSVVGQIIPKGLKAIVSAALKGQRDVALALQRRYLEIMEAMFWETNPLPVKQALALRGQLKAVWKGPLAAPEAATTERLRALLQRLDLLSSPYAGDAAEAAQKAGAA